MASDEQKDHRRFVYCESTGGFHRATFSDGVLRCEGCGRVCDPESDPLFHRTATKYEVNKQRRDLARHEKRMEWYARQDAHRDALARRQRQLDAEARREAVSVALRAVHAAAVQSTR